MLILLSDHKVYEMYNSETNSFLKTRFITICALFFALSFNCNANDVERINKLEKEVQEMKARLSTLESLNLAPKSNPSQVTQSSGMGWKSIPAWRQLKKGMNPTEVQTILGEPDRVRGGSFTTWSYPNGGQVTYYNNALDQWTEPR